MNRSKSMYAVKHFGIWINLYKMYRKRRLYVYNNYYIMFSSHNYWLYFDYRNEVWKHHLSNLTQQVWFLLIRCFQLFLLHKHFIYNQLWQLKTKFMNNLCKVGFFVRGIGERERFMSPARETLLEGDWSKMREGSRVCHWLW